jgi:hypothetical protein
MVNKHIGTVFLLDETKTLAVVKPLDYTFCHGGILLSKNFPRSMLKVATMTKIDLSS